MTGLYENKAIMNNKRQKVSKGQFAEVLYHWLSLNITEKEINEKAKDFGFKIRNDNDFNNIFAELLVFNMWLIVYTCEAVFNDKYKRNECLDIFHRFVYERHFYEKGQDFWSWMKLVLQKYQEYYTARETEHPSTPLWVVAQLIIKNVLGENTNNLEALLKIMAYQTLTFEHLATALKNYDIE